MSLDSVTPLRGRRAWLLAVGLFALVLRLYSLGDENLWIDEIYQVRVGAQPISDILANYKPSAAYYTTDQAPLSMIVTHFFVGDMDQEWLPRIPSVIFGTMEVVVLLLVATPLLGFRTALLASVLLALSPLHLRYSQEARWYAQWSLLSTLSYLALLRACRRDTGVHWAAYGLCRVASLYTFIMSVLVTASQLVTLMWKTWNDPAVPDGGDSPGRWRILSRFVATNLVVVVAGAPVAWVVLSLVGRTTGTPRPAAVEELLYTAYAFAAGFSLGPTLEYLHGAPSLSEILVSFPIVSIIAIVFAPPLLLGALRLYRDPNAGGIVLPWCIGPPVFMFIVGVATNLTYEVRYTLAALPAFYLVVAAGVSKVTSRQLQAVLAGSVVACTVYGAGSYYWDDRYDREDVKGAISYIDTYGTDGAQVIGVGQILLAVEHYGMARGMAIHECGGSGSDPALSDMPTPPEPTRELWLAVGRDWDDDAVRCLEWLSSSYEIAEQQQFTGVELWRLLPRRLPAG